MALLGSECLSIDTDMVLFLTSSPCIEGKGDINPANGLRDELGARIGHNAHAVFVTATPDDVGMTEWAAYSMKHNLEEAGLTFASYEVLDWRSAEEAEALVQRSDLIILGGGHVPTQNRFMHEIHLRDLLQSYDGVVVGISAGSMNCADPVYAQPEEPGESVDANYRRFLHGLRLTTVQVLPHFQKTRKYMLDGRRLLEDITFADSRGHQFYGLPDGSYIFSDGRREEIRGEAYLIANGMIDRVCNDNERRVL